MIEAETETAEIPIKKTAQVVLAMGSTSSMRVLIGDVVLFTFTAAFITWLVIQVVGLLS
jgi:hypothetical protein